MVQRVHHSQSLQQFETERVTKVIMALLVLVLVTSEQTSQPTNIIKREL